MKQLDIITENIEIAVRECDVKRVKLLTILKKRIAKAYENPTEQNIEKMISSQIAILKEAKNFYVSYREKEVNSEKIQSEEEFLAALNIEKALIEAEDSTESEIETLSALIKALSLHGK